MRALHERSQWLESHLGHDRSLRRSSVPPTLAVSPSIIWFSNQTFATSSQFCRTPLNTWSSPTFTLVLAPSVTSCYFGPIPIVSGDLPYFGRSQNVPTHLRPCHLPIVAAEHFGLITGLLREVGRALEKLQCRSSRNDVAGSDGGRSRCEVG